MTDDAGPVHELTVEIDRDVYDPDLWRVTGTCSCLGFAFTGASPHRAVVEAGADEIDRRHVLHMARIAAHPERLPDPSEWLS